MKKYLLPCVAFLLLACNSNKQAEGPSVPVPEPPYELALKEVVKGKSVVTPLSDIAAEITYIPLETTDQSLFRRIHSYLFIDNTLLINDFQHIFQFSKEGRFMQQIGQRGNGPADYNYIQSIVRNEEAPGQFYLFSDHKIMSFTSSGKYLNSVKLEEPDNLNFSTVVTPNGNFFFYAGAHFRVVADTTTIYSFFEVDKQGKVVNKIPNASPVEATFPGMIATQVPVYRYEDDIRYMDLGNDTLFSYSKNREILPYAICSFDELTKVISMNPADQNINENKYGINNICEDEKYLYISVSYGMEGKRNYILYDKMTGELTHLGEAGLFNDLDGGLPFFPQFIEEDGTMVMYLQSETFVEKILEMDYETNKQKYGDKFEKLYQLASQTEIDDNPVFILAKR